jgi:hypothetical protein
MMKSRKGGKFAPIAKENLGTSGELKRVFTTKKKYTKIALSRF